MEPFTWLSAVKSKEQLTTLIALTEEGVLEEIFIAQSVDAGVAGENWPVGQVLVFAFSASEAVEKRLQEIAPTISLDSLDDSHFEVNDGVYTLKYVFYPESEAQEEQIIALLV